VCEGAEDGLRLMSIQHCAKSKYRRKGNGCLSLKYCGFDQPDTQTMFKRFKT